MIWGQGQASPGARLRALVTQGVPAWRPLLGLSLGRNGEYWKAGAASSSAVPPTAPSLPGFPVPQAPRPTRGCYHLATVTSQASVTQAG